MVEIKVSSKSEYKVKNGLSCIEQFGNLGQNGTCYYIDFDEWKDIPMHTVYVVVLNQNTVTLIHSHLKKPYIITCKILHESSVARCPANKFVRAHADY